MSTTTPPQPEVTVSSAIRDPEFPHTALHDVDPERSLSVVLRSPSDNRRQESVEGAGAERRIRPAERLAEFGWSKRDAVQYAEEFGRIGAPFVYSTPGTKLYVEAKFRDQERDVLRSRGFDSSIARHHLLGDYDAAPMPPSCCRAIQTDWDSEEDCRAFLHWISRDRADLSWMFEPSPKGGGHVYIPVQPGPSPADWARITSDMVVKATRSDVDLVDIVRVDTNTKLRLPFSRGRRAELSTGKIIEIRDPAAALSAWRVWMSLRRHRISTIERIVNRYRKPGRPATRRVVIDVPPTCPRCGSAGSVSHDGPDQHSSIEESSRRCNSLPSSSSPPVRPGHPAPAPGTMGRGPGGHEPKLQLKQNAGTSVRLLPATEFREFPGRGAKTRRIVEVGRRVGSTKGRRWKNGRKVVGLLLNYRCPKHSLVDEALRVFLDTGSRDARKDPAGVRKWLAEYVVPWVLQNHRDRRRCG